MKSKNRLKELFTELFIISAGVFAMALFYRHNIILTFLLAAGSAFEIFLWHSRKDILVFAVAAVIGPMAEILNIYFGNWNYSNPSFFGIPMWLPFVWGISMLTIKRIGETL